MSKIGVDIFFRTYEQILHISLKKKRFKNLFLKRLKCCSGDLKMCVLLTFLIALSNFV